MMKKANEIAKITKESLDKKARDYLFNKGAGLIIKAAEEGKDSVTLRLPTGFTIEECNRIGPEIVRILENEFDYVAEYSCYADYREHSADIKVSWGYAIK